MKDTIQSIFFLKVVSYHVVEELRAGVILTDNEQMRCANRNSLKKTKTRENWACAQGPTVSRGASRIVKWVEIRVKGLIYM